MNMAHYKTFFKSQRPVRVLFILVFFLEMNKDMSSYSRDKDFLDFVFTMLAFYQMTPSISSDFLITCRKLARYYYNQKRSIMFSFRLKRRRRSVNSIETFAHFLKNARRMTNLVKSQFAQTNVAILKALNSKMKQAM